MYRVGQRFIKTSPHSSSISALLVNVPAHTRFDTPSSDAGVESLDGATRYPVGGAGHAQEGNLYGERKARLLIAVDTN